MNWLGANDDPSESEEQERAKRKLPNPNSFPTGIEEHQSAAGDDAFPDRFTDGVELVLAEVLALFTSTSVAPPTLITATPTTTSFASRSCSFLRS